MYAKIMPVRVSDVVNEQHVINTACMFSSTFPKNQIH